MTITIGQLSDGHAKQLVPASQMLYVFIAFMQDGYPVENSLRQEPFYMSKDRFALIIAGYFDGQHNSFKSSPSNFAFKS